MSLGWSQQQLAVELSLDKTTYYVTEPMYLTRSFVNTTIQPIPLYYISFDCLFIEDDKGQFYYPNVQFSGPGHTIAPGDSFSYINELVSTYGNPWLESENEIYGFPVEVYTTQLKCQDKYVQVTSNILKFHIIEPEGEEKDALKLYTKMYYMNLYKKEFDPEETIRVGLTLVEKYPNSVYSPSVLMLANVIEESKTGSLKYFEQLINDYPNNWSAADAIKYHVNVFDNYGDLQKARIKNIMRSVTNKFPGSIVAKEATNQLIRIEMQ